MCACQVCEVFLELLPGQGLLYCISKAKFEGKDFEREIIAYIGNCKAWPARRHTLNQLKDLMESGLSFNGWHLNVCILECHDLACMYSIVTRGVASALGLKNCLWCSISKKTLSWCDYGDTTSTWWYDYIYWTMLAYATFSCASTFLLPFYMYLMCIIFLFFDYYTTIGV